MGNIVGDNPAREIVDQINLRQGALGVENRNSDILTWMASSTPFIRLTSCVSISEQKCQELDIDVKYAGMGLAKAFVLLGGVWSEDQVDVEDSSPFKAGVRNTADNKLINNFAYGFGGDSFGLVPPPGITSLDINSLTRGSVRKASVKLKVNSVEQLKLIETLYLRMGYNVLIEYGHSVYLDNKGIYQTTDALSSAYNMLMYGDPLNNYTQFDIQKALKQDILKSQGNYDGFLGRVVNFNWAFDDKGSFDVSLELFGVGDVAESFKINVGPDTSVDNVKDIPLTGAEGATKINLFLVGMLLKTLGKQPETFDKVLRSYRNYTKEDTISSLKVGTKNVIATENNKRKVEVTTLTSIFQEPFIPKDSDDKDFISNASSFSPYISNPAYAYLDYVEGNSDFYITLRELLRFIEANCLAYSEGDESPLLRIDTSLDNLCYTHPYQLSSNPEVCLIPGKIINIPTARELNSLPTSEKEKIAQGNDTKFTSDFPGYKVFEEVLGDAFRKPYISTENGPSEINNPFVGSLLDVWVNKKTINRLLTSKPDSPNVTIYDFLSNLVSEIQFSLGNINKLDVTFDTESSTLKLTESLPLKDYIDTPPSVDQIARFQIYGVYPNNGVGSFVTNLKFDAKISNSMKAMVVAGSSQGGNNSGVNNTAFSRWNEGLVDVLFAKKAPDGTTTLSAPDPETPEAPPKEFTWFFDSKAFTEYSAQLDKSSDAGASYYIFSNSKIITGAGQENKDAQSAFQTALSDFSVGFSSFVANFIKPQSPNPEAYIPLTMGLTFKGLSGLKVFDKIFINDDVLPPNYPKNLAFIVKKVNHKISNKGWETDIDCMSYGVPNELNVEPLSAQSGDKNFYIQQISANQG